MMKLLAFLLLLFVTVRANVWTNLVLQFQRQAAETQPIDQLSLPCAHNSFNNPSNLPDLLIEYENLILFKGKIIFENQELTMTQLLNLGVRHLQLEAHFIPEYNQTWLCHSAPEAALICPFVESATGESCEELLHIEDLGISTGCTKDARSWESGIIEVANWVKSNPQEFLIIEVIDFASNVTGSNETQFAGPIIQYLGPYLVTNANMQAVSASTGKPWPSIQDLRNAINKTVILIGVQQVFPTIIPYIISSNPTLIQVNDFSSCNGVSNPVFDIVYEDKVVLNINILGFNISASGSETVGVFTPSIFSEVFGCGFSACADRIDSNNIANFAWSWSGNSTQIACQPNMCAAMVNGHWTQLSCSQTLQAACQSLSNPNQWALSVTQTQGNQTVTCPSGFTFSYPKIPLSNVVLQNVQTSASASSIWLNVPLSYQPNHPICSYVPESSASSLMASMTAVVVAFLFLQFFNRL